MGLSILPAWHVPVPASLGCSGGQWSRHPESIQGSGWGQEEGFPHTPPVSHIALGAPTAWQAALEAGGMTQSLGKGLGEKFGGIRLQEVKLGAFWSLFTSVS